MTLILDYSFARPSPTVIKTVGYSGVMRYLSHDPSKDLSKAEAAALHAAGLDIGLVWETTANRASQGFAAGATDATSAETQAAALGYPTTAVLFYAVDYDAAPAAVAPYFAGVASKARHPVGVYGSARVVEGTNVPYKWQATAWSGGRVSTVAHLYQRLRATVSHPVAGTDENVVLRPFPMWTNAVVAPTPPPVVSRDNTRAPLIVLRGPFPLATGRGYTVGSTGWGVNEIQVLVGATPVDGKFGPITAAHVTAWTSAHGPYVTGVVNKQVWDHMAAFKP